MAYPTGEAESRKQVVPVMQWYIETIQRFVCRRQQVVNIICLLENCITYDAPFSAGAFYVLVDSINRCGCITEIHTLRIESPIRFAQRYINRWETD